MASRIEGRIRMRRVLKILPATTRARLRTAVLAGGEEIANMQRRLVAVDEGDLQKSIKVTPGDENVPAYASLKSKRVSADPELAAIITAGNTKVRTAHLVEFGTAPHTNAGMFPGTQHPGTAAQPFFYPSFRARKRSVQNRINKAARQGIKDGLK